MAQHDLTFYKTVSRIAHDMGGSQKYSNELPYQPGKMPLEPDWNDLVGVLPTLALHDVVQLSPELERMTRRAKVLLQDNASPAYLYSSCEDFIRMPRPSCFRTIGHFKNAMFHEMGHWTGPRLGRRRSNSKADYCLEEITAELTAAVLCDVFEVKGDFRHAAYIANYAKQSKGALVAGIKQAKEASQYLLRLAEERKES